MSETRRLDRAALNAHPLPPVIDGGKETKGRVLILAGSRDVPGAALLAATAAMRAGAGELRIATVESAAARLGMAMPEAMVIGLPEAEDGGFATAAVRRNAACGKITSTLLGCGAALALDVAFLESLREADQKRARLPILLPNADELVSLLDCDERDVEADPVRCGRSAAQRYKSIVLVKGVVSHVVTPAGDCWSYHGGVPGLGVSGSGDVLAGIVGGLLARGAQPLNALLWAVWLHGSAGEALAKRIGPIGFLAREIADAIPGLLPR